MHLLSALSSTTSPLAMQAMPLVAPPTGDFAALIAGMVPGGDAAAVAMPDERQAPAPAGNGLPVTLAAPVVLPDTVPATAPPLPVSATEAVLMLPDEAAAPVAPAVQKVAPLVVATAAIGVLADVLPEQEPVETPPRAEDLAARALPMPMPTRFAMPQPRVKRADTATPDATPRDTEDASVDPELRAEGDAPPLVAAPPVVPQPAEAIVLPPAPIPGDPAKPAASLVVEDGEVAASAPASAGTPPMRMAKRAGEPLPDTARRPAPATEPRLAPARSAGTAEPAIGVATPLDTDRVVPVHVVVPPVANSYTPVVAQPVAPMTMSAISGATPSMSTPPLAVPPVAAPMIAPTVSATPSTVLPIAPATASTPAAGPAISALPSGVSPTTPRVAAASSGVVPAAPVAAVAPGGLAGVMIDLLAPDQPLPVAAPVPIASNPVEVTPTAIAAAAPQAVEAQLMSRPAPAAAMSGDAAPVASRSAQPIDRAPTTPASIERPAATPMPSGDARAPAPPADPIVDRRPIASEAAAPVVAVAPPLLQPTVVAPPVTRIAGVPDAMPATDAGMGDSADVTSSVRHTTDVPAGTAAATPPVTRIAAVPVAEVAPVVDAVLRDADTLAPRARRDDDVAIPASTGTPAPDAAVLRPVAPTAQAAQPALDTRQPQWVEGMIDRIATLRESSGTNSGETRIRLSPDALGDVEVAIRTGDDGRLHVHFNSDNADAGRLLAEAQPRLVQMAEARGLKLGGMQVDVGSQQSQQSGQSQRQAQDQGHAAPRAPRPAGTRATTQTTRSTDRIA